MKTHTSLLSRFADGLMIAHHIPGRVRLKLAGGSSSALPAFDAVEGFRRAVASVPGIRSVNLNLLARSCVVEYDPATIPPQAWRDAVEGTSSPEALDLIDAIGRATAG